MKPPEAEQTRPWEVDYLKAFVSNAQKSFKKYAIW